MSDPTEQAQSGYATNGYSQSNYGYEAEGYSEQPQLGAGDSSWQVDHVSDGYRENVFEVNFTDTPYTESLNNPNPQIDRYKTIPYVAQSENSNGTDRELEL
jgi:hypothetical protein